MLMRQLGHIVFNHLLAYDAALLTYLITSQASVERVFSSAGWQDRGSMSRGSLKQEVFIRVNALQLGYSP